MRHQRNGGLVLAGVALAALLALPARAEVRSLRLGIGMDCPYGLAG